MPLNPNLEADLGTLCKELRLPGGRAAHAAEAERARRESLTHERYLLEVLRGSDAASTLITSRMSAVDAGGTFFSPIVEVNGAAFEAENISFENTSGTGSQAVAISVHSDRASFRNCRFLGW